MNINVGIGYLEAWLRGVGCVPLHNLMEDAATAEISRAQVWQWIRHRAKLSDGRLVDWRRPPYPVTPPGPPDEAARRRLAEVLGIERSDPARAVELARSLSDDLSKRTPCDAVARLSSYSVISSVIFALV